jgi:hypothetical protein
VADDTFSRDDITAAFRPMTEKRRQIEAARDGWSFWQRNLPRPWPRGVAEEVAMHDSTPQDPFGVASAAAMDLAEYARNRDKLGVKDASDFLGVDPWKRPTTEGAR